MEGTGCPRIEVYVTIAKCEMLQTKDNLEIVIGSKEIKVGGSMPHILFEPLYVIKIYQIFPRLRMHSAIVLNTFAIK